MLSGSRGPDDGKVDTGIHQTNFDDARRIRVVLGPQDQLLESESLEEFLNSEWQLTNDSDRMGLRLAGPEMKFKPRAEYLVRAAGALPSNVVVDVTAIGAIQITTGSEAILMGVEVQSIGGFAKPVTVISVDQCRIGQVRPGEKIRFEVVDAEKAVEIYRETVKEISGYIT